MKPNKKTIFVAMVLAIPLVVTCSRSTIVAEVDGFKITSDDLAASMQIEKEKYDPIILKTDANARAFKRAVLENLIQEAVLLNTAKNKGIGVSNEELKKALDETLNAEILEKKKISADEWRKKQRRRMMIRKLIKEEVEDKIPLTHGEVSNYYKEHRKVFYQPVQYRARQIVVDNKELANQIVARIGKGEDFAKLAEEYSLSPDRKMGGDLGYFNATTFPTVFSDICDKLKIGETSGVVTTDYGYQIFQLLDKRQARQLSEEEVAPRIESLLREKHLEGAFEEWFKMQREKAKITIYEKELEDVNV